MEHFQIAIDGPSGSGKSTLARSVAQKLGILYLDTGAMYRACGLYAVDNNVSTKDESAISELMDSIDIEIVFVNGAQKVFLNKADVTDRIRLPGISQAASDVSRFRIVRERMVDMQRQIAGEKNVVLDGRDIGSYVLPNADFKFFLTADIRERAKRRLEEMLSKGVHDMTIEEVMADLEYRDEQDSNRAFAPLKKTSDAIEIDTTANTPQETLLALLGCLPKSILENAHDKDIL
ncbi:MAG: (d)CMP kinase [Clostridiaceae bacterium]|nr:(d)CMP kinase [Clostridiaceae bacterium]